MHLTRKLPLAAVLTVVLATTGHTAEKPLKTFILAGQSNMVGWTQKTGTVGKDVTDLAAETRKSQDDSSHAGRPFRQ